MTRGPDGPALPGCAPRAMRRRRAFERAAAALERSAELSERHADRADARGEEAVAARNTGVRAGRARRLPADGRVWPSNGYRDRCLVAAETAAGATTASWPRRRPRPTGHTSSRRPATAMRPSVGTARRAAVGESASSNSGTGSPRRASCSGPRGQSPWSAVTNAPSARSATTVRHPQVASSRKGGTTGRRRRPRERHNVSRGANRKTRRWRLPPACPAREGRRRGAFCQRFRRLVRAEGRCQLAAIARGGRGGEDPGRVRVAWFVRCKLHPFADGGGR